MYLGESLDSLRVEAARLQQGINQMNTLIANAVKSGAAKSLVDSYKAGKAKLVGTLADIRAKINAQEKPSEFMTGLERLSEGIQSVPGELGKGAGEIGKGLAEGLKPLLIPAIVIGGIGLLFYSGALRGALSQRIRRNPRRRRR